MCGLILVTWVFWGSAGVGLVCGGAVDCVYCLIVWFGLLVFVLRCLHVVVAKVGVVWCDIVCLSL